MRTASSATLAAPLALLLAACGPAASAAPGRGLEVVATLADAGAAARVVIEIDAGAETRRAELAADGVQWRGALAGLPGTGTLSARAVALDAAGGVLAQARAEGLDLPAGQRGLLVLGLVGPEPAAVPGALVKATNRPPVIVWILASSLTVPPGGTILLAALAYDPDLLDNLRLRYQWTADAGRFSAPTSPLTAWTAPATPGPVTVTLAVRDPKGALATASFAVSVQASPGAAAVTSRVNSGPRVTAMTVSDGQADLGQPVALTATGADADGDPLQWSWSASCAGSFEPASGPATTFTAAAPPPPGGACTLVAMARDGRGGVGEGRLGVVVGRPPAVATAPVFGATWQDAEVAAAGEVLAFEVAARSALPLAYGWAATAGTLAPAPPSAGFDSAVRWTAACAPAGFATVVATASDGTTSASQGFVVAVPTCP